jgi:hypothetical protein
VDDLRRLVNDSLSISSAPTSDIEVGLSSQRLSEALNLLLGIELDATEPSPPLNG